MQYRIVNINDIPEQDYHRYYLLMSDEKQKKVDKYRFADDMRRTIAGEMLAREMIAECCKVDVENIVFCENKYRKPIVKNYDINFNISHSGDLVVCAVNKVPIGIDIEKIREIDNNIISHICTKHECDYIYGKETSHEEFLKRFFMIWTFKEACFKCIGTGITDPKKINYFNKKHGRKLICYDHYIIHIVTESDKIDKKLYL